MTHGPTKSEIFDGTSSLLLCKSHKGASCDGRSLPAVVTQRSKVKVEHLFSLISVNACTCRGREG